MHGKTLAKIEGSAGIRRLLLPHFLGTNVLIVQVSTYCVAFLKTCKNFPPNIFFFLFYLI